MTRCSRRMPNVSPPAHWAAGGARAAPWPTTGWPRFNEPRLDALVREALAYNSDLRLAAARVEQAVAYLSAAKSPLWPQVNLMARGGGKMSGDSSGLEGVGLFASWELDLWGRVRAVTRSTELQYESAQLDAEFARQSIAALTAKGWVLAVEARLAREQAERDAEAPPSNWPRWRAIACASATATSSRSRWREASVETQRDTLRSLDLAYGNALRALESLLGRYPAASVAVSDALPAWPGDAPAGVPSELLERRPDVVAAERRVAAAFYRVEEAKAARLPRITLVANFTSISSELFVLQNRDNPLFSFGAGLLQPVFLGGLLQAQVAARTAEQQAALADYGKIGQRAFGEVEGALSAAVAAGDRGQILARGDAPERACPRTGQHPLSRRQHRPARRTAAAARAVLVPHRAAARAIGTPGATDQPPSRRRRQLRHKDTRGS